MNDLTFFALLILVLIRAIGIIISVEFYYDSKSKTYLLFVIGWCLWAIAGIVPIFSELTTNQFLSEIFLFMNYILAPLAICILLMAIFSYYKTKLSIRFYIFLIVLIIFPIIIYILFGFFYLSLYARAFQMLGIILLILFPIRNFKKFKEKIGKSIRWYYLSCFSILIYFFIIIFLIINNELTGLFQSENILNNILNYASIIMMTIFIIVFIIHLEYNITNEQRKDLKDKYSHNLGNILQAIETAHFITNFENNYTKKNLEEAKEIMKKKFKEASETLNEIRKL